MNVYEFVLQNLTFKSEQECMNSNQNQTSTPHMMLRAFVAIKRTLFLDLSLACQQNLHNEGVESNPFSSQKLGEFNGNKGEVFKLYN